MTRFMCALGSAVAISGAALVAQASIKDVNAVGCIRLWQPAPADPTKMPPDRQPGLAGVYLLTPLASNPGSPLDLPTYVLTPSGTLNFSQHVGHQVEIVGAAQPAITAPAPRAAGAGPEPRPENKPSTNGMPRLTVTTLKMVRESCP
jgi:hypothetical protein